MVDVPANSAQFSYESAESYLKFAIQFTPQYGDSFLEMMKLYILTGQSDKLQQLKQLCMHSEPNYGVLWFFYKETFLDNPIEVWDRAEKIIRQEIKSSNGESEGWMASRELISYLRNGLRNCPYATKFKIIYGFEQVLP